MIRKKRVLRSNYIALFAIGLVMFLSACKKENFKDHAGPSICPSDDFAYSVQPSLNKTTYNFNADTLKLRADLNEDVKWSVKIVGLTSKSYKEFSGYGDKVVINWIGNPDTLKFFETENCELTFTVGCLESEAIVLPFSISTTNNFSNFNYLVYNADAGSLGAGPFAYGTYATHGVQSGLNSPQGGDCYCTVGNSASTPVWFFGGFDLNTTLTTAGLNSDPTKVYFNAFVNVRGAVGSLPVVTFTEGAVKRNKNLDGLSGSGWHYVSFKLSDANILNPADVSVVSFGLNAFPEQGTSGDVCVDFVLLTNDAPFISAAK